MAPELEADEMVFLVIARLNDEWNL